MIKKGKKTLLILCIGIILCIMAAFSFIREEQNLKRISVHGDMVTYEGLTDLENMADLVVIAEPTANFTDRDHILKMGEDESLEDFYTHTEIKIYDVLLNNDQSNYGSGDLLSIIEPSSVLEENGEEYEFVMDHYTSVNKGSNYIFFLKKNTFGEYSLIGNQFGKFNIDGSDPKDMAIESKSLNNSKNVNSFKKIFKIEKLNEEFKYLLTNTQDGMHTESEQSEELRHAAEKKLNIYLELTKKYDDYINNHLN